MGLWGIKMHPSTQFAISQTEAQRARDFLRNQDS
jgi:hypothetical protein